MEPSTSKEKSSHGSMAIPMANYFVSPVCVRNAHLHSTSREENISTITRLGWAILICYIKRVELLRNAMFIYQNAA